MEYTVQNPVLVTLTAPSAAGKSYLFNYIRDVAKLPCLISTTTRSPRAGEVEGVDYFFISDEQSKAIEKDDQFAELAIYRGVRYGVTKTEFFSKLGQGVAFLIVEPSGIAHYVQPALEIGASHLKYFIHTPFDIRLSRFKKRVDADLTEALSKFIDPVLGMARDQNSKVLKIVSSSMDRLLSMATTEQQWGQATAWTRTLFGEDDPQVNLSIIERDIKTLQEKMNEYRSTRE